MKEKILAANMLVALSTLIIKLMLWISSSLLTYFLLTLSLVFAYTLYKTKIASHWRLPVDPKSAILITGATSGIGLAVAKYLYSLGYSVIATYYNDKELGHAELLKISQNPGSKAQQLILIEMNVCSDESIKIAGKKCRVELERRQLKLYAIVNNAGLGSLQPFPWLRRETIKALIETNLTGCMLVTREFLPLLIKSKGRILNVSSGLGFVPGDTYVIYGATKCAQLYLTRALNLELNKLKCGNGVCSVAIIPHNFIKNTNICAQSVKTNELAWKELSEEERRLYEIDFLEHNELIEKLEKATRDLRANSKDPNGKKDGRHQNSKSRTSEHLVGKLISILRMVVASINGQNQASSLEESGALQGFEDALRLRNPPEQIFAGDLAYTLLVGSLLLSLPNICSKLLSSSVKPGLYS